MAQPNVFIFEGIDRVSKSTTIKNLQERLGVYQIIASGKPPVLDRYRNVSMSCEDTLLEPTEEQLAQAVYQKRYFENLFQLIKSSKNSARLVFDRLHLGEMVYSPLYRNVVPNSIMRMERDYFGGTTGSKNMRLILLTEDLKISKHFVSDGESFDDTKRVEEQEKFIEAFNKSVIQDKRKICVTGPDGNFKSELEILLEVLI